MFIFDCNGVLVDSEAIVANVAATELTRAGFAVSPEIIGRFFTGRRPIDMLVDIETATQRKLPPNFAKTLAAATLRRLKVELRATAHVEHALTWLRGPKCVASSSPPDRVRTSLETAGLAKFFNFLFSASDVRNGKPAPDLFLHAASRMGVQAADCIVVEDSPAGVSAAVCQTAGSSGAIARNASHSGLNAPDACTARARLARASVAAARVALKLTGNLRPVAASMLASMSAGRRPEK